MLSPRLVLTLSGVGCSVLRHRSFHRSFLLVSPLFSTPTWKCNSWHWTLFWYYIPSFYKNDDLYKVTGDNRGQGLPSDRYRSYLFILCISVYINSTCLLDELFLRVKTGFHFSPRSLLSQFFYKACREISVKCVKKWQVATFIELIYLIK